MIVLEDPTDVMVSAISHNEIQKVGITASKSIEKFGILGGLLSSYYMYWDAWSSATSFYSLSWDGVVLRFGLYSQDNFIVSRQK